jgi:hypothetical protein
VDLAGVVIAFVVDELRSVLCVWWPNFSPKDIKGKKKMLSGL